MMLFFTFHKMAMSSRQWRVFSDSGFLLILTILSLYPQDARPYPFIFSKNGNLETLKDNCPKRTSPTWKARAKRMNCSGETTYHCAKDYDSSKPPPDCPQTNSSGCILEQFVEGCAEVKNCSTGEEPVLSFIKNQQRTDQPEVFCVPCRNINRYNDRLNEIMSSEFSECPYRKINICTAKEHKLLCKKDDTTDERFCRCDARKGYFPYNLPDDHPVSGCSYTNYECINTPPRCTNQELLLNYSCAAFCAKGYHRPANSDDCVPDPTWVNTTLSIVTDTIVTDEPSSLPVTVTKITSTTVALCLNCTDESDTPSMDGIKIAIIVTCVCIFLVIVIVLCVCYRGCIRKCLGLGTSGPNDDAKSKKTEDDSKSIDSTERLSDGDDSVAMEPLIKESGNQTEMGEHVLSMKDVKHESDTNSGLIKDVQVDVHEHKGNATDENLSNEQLSEFKVAEETHEEGRLNSNMGNLYRRERAGARGQLVSTVMDRSYVYLLDHMDPIAVLDRFRAKEIFTHVLRRDISQLSNQTDKSRAIIKRVRETGIRNYVAFKKCLLESKQNDCLEKVEEIQSMVLQSISERSVEVASDNSTYHTQLQEDQNVSLTKYSGEDGGGSLSRTRYSSIESQTKHNMDRCEVSKRVGARFVSHQNVMQPRFNDTDVGLLTKNQENEASASLASRFGTKEDTETDVGVLQNTIPSLMELSTKELWNFDLSHGNEEAIYFLLEHRNLMPNNSVLKEACRVYGKASYVVDRMCTKICEGIKEKYSIFPTVWPAYRKDDENRIVFVAVGKSEYIELFHFLDFELLVRGKNLKSLENRDVIEKVVDDDKILDNGTMFQLRNVINMYSEQLRQQHTNISYISASPYKSTGYCTENHTLLEKACVVIFVHVKGMIPIKEEPFPETQAYDGSIYNVDIREGAFQFYVGGESKTLHTDLKAGCAIGPHGTKVLGTLGGFIDHREYGLCAITCAHVLLDAYQIDKQTPNPYIVCNQPHGDDPENKNSCGVLQHHVFRKGSASETGVDAALVKLDVSRKPLDGVFPDIDIEDLKKAGFDHKEEIRYTSGAVHETADILKHKDRRLIKIGAETSLKRGVLGFHGSDFKYTPMMYGRFVDLIIRNQIEVYHIKRCGAFSEPGDSGSLVLSVSEDGLIAIGLVLGGDTGFSVVTPICDVLKALGYSAPYSLKRFLNSSEETNRCNTGHEG